MGAEDTFLKIQNFFTLLLPQFELGTPQLKVFFLLFLGGY